MTEEIVNRRTGEIIPVSKLETMLVRADTLGDVKKIVDITELVTEAYKIRGYTEEANQSAILAIKGKRKGGEFLRGLEKSVGGRPSGNLSSVGQVSEFREAIDEADLQRAEAYRWIDLANINEVDFYTSIEDKQKANQEKGKFVEITTNGILRDFKEQRRKREIEELISRIEERTPEGLFNVIVIDPPWPYGTEYSASGRRAANPYPEMSLEEIGNIKLPAAEDCVLWLWTTHKFMRYSFVLLDKWQFRDVAILTWVKDRMGLGQWLRSQSEFCIMAVRGKPVVKLTNQTTVINGPMREHSRKPDEFYKMVDELCTGRKYEHFSRQEREGWTVYGNETDRFVE